MMVTFVLKFEKREIYGKANASNRVVWSDWV